MAIGFFMANRITNWGPGKIVWIQSSNIGEARHCIDSSTVDGLGISKANGFEIDDLSFLQDFPDLKGLVIPFASDYGLTPLYCLKDLQFLTIGENTDSFDYSSFKELRDLQFDWHHKLKLPQPDSLIQTLAIWSFKTRSKSLAEFPAYKNLSKLQLIRGNLTQLDGIERLTSLKNGDFSYLNQLNSIKALGGTKIEFLSLENCKKVIDYEALKACTYLNLLVLSGQGKIPSLKFINDFQALEELRFIETTISDRDMTPLLNLKKAAFNRCNYYSHTPEQINQLLSEKGRANH